MQSLCNTASEAYPGLYVVCANVANSLASITTPLAEQIEEFANFVKADPRLQGGFHAVGLSQGGLVLRGYVETHNEPPVHRLVSVCSPHAGIGVCPTSSLYKMVCPLWKLAPYTARFSFADYWKDAGDQQQYLERSRWLADMNNEREAKNDDYKRRLTSLERYVLVEAVNDTTVSPHVSESHGFYSWGSWDKVLALRETEGYQGDFIGLKTLDESGKLVQLTYAGDHLQFSDEFWAKVVIPHLGP
jgi:palmitoyl-protein thioesterase